MLKKILIPTIFVQSLFIKEVVLEMPDTGTEAMAKETIHLARRDERHRRPHVTRSNDAKDIMTSEMGDELALSCTRKFSFVS